MEEALEKIRDFADKAHGSQLRKYTPERYIVHPVRVMEICLSYTKNVSVLAAALLHDVLEDTSVKEEEMLSFLAGILGHDEGVKTVKLVVELTDIYTKQNYPKWNRKKRKSKESQRIEASSAEAQTIKYADIIDNCKEIVEYDPEFAWVFIKECKGLLMKMLKGDADLYKLAVSTVKDCIARLESQDR